MDGNYYGDLKFCSFDVDAGPFGGVVDYVNSHRNELEGLVQMNIARRNVFLDQYYPAQPRFRFTLEEMLDEPYSKNFKTCMPELYPLANDQVKSWWYPLMIYFIGTNQFKKYWKTAKAIEEWEWDSADYGLLLRAVCLLRPRDFTTFFLYTFEQFCFGYSYRTYNPINIDPCVWDRADMAKITQWAVDMKLLNRKRDVLSRPKYEDHFPVPISEEKRADYEENHDENWEAWLDASETKFRLLMLEFGLAK